MGNIMYNIEPTSQDLAEVLALIDGIVRNTSLVIPQTHGDI